MSLKISSTFKLPFCRCLTSGKDVRWANEKYILCANLTHFNTQITATLTLLLVFVYKKNEPKIFLPVKLTALIGFANLHFSLLRLMTW